jgi:hypothetical protein
MPDAVPILLTLTEVGLSHFGIPLIISDAGFPGIG